MAKCRVYAYHGWACSSAIWKPIAKNRDDIFDLHSDDRGYFGGRNHLDRFGSSHKTILLVHSHGLHRVPKEILMDASAVLFISSFFQFHPDNPPEKKASKRKLARMITKFKLQPEVVLAQFYSAAYYPSDQSGKVTGQRDDEKLLSDLRNLDESRFRYDDLLSQKKCAVIYGSDDRIVNSRVWENLISSLSQSTSVHEIEGGGHMLPETHPEKISEVISQMSLRIGN